MSAIDTYLVFELDTAALDSMGRGHGSNNQVRNTTAIERLEEAMENHGYEFRTSVKYYCSLPSAILLRSNGSVPKEKAGAMKMHHIFIEENRFHLPYPKKHAF